MQTNPPRETTSVARQPGLGLDSPRISADDGKRSLLLTNRNNLVEFLTYGAIRPPALMDKYYADLADTCPHALVLLREDPSTELSEYVMRDSPTAFPVLLELDTNTPSGAVFINATDMLPGCMVVPGIIPLSRVLTVHFKSASDLMEFQMRDFSDVREDQVRTEITPERFEGRVVDLERLKSVVGDAGQRVQSVPRERLESVDALAGSLLLVAGVTQHTDDPDFEPLRAALTLLTGNPENSAQARHLVGKAMGATRWIGFAPLLMLSPQKLSSTISSLTSSTGDLEAGLLFGVVLRYMADLEPHQFVPRSAATDIRSRFETELTTFENADGKRLLELLDLLGGVLRLTVEFDSFPVSDQPVVTGLLYFLLRSSPDQVDSWLTESRGTSNAAAILAAAFSGALYGRAGVPVALRGSAELERVVDHLTTRALVAASPDQDRAPVDTFTIVRGPSRKGIEAVQLCGVAGVLLSREVAVPPQLKPGVTTPASEKKPRTRSATGSRKKDSGRPAGQEQGTDGGHTSPPEAAGPQEPTSPEDVLALIERLIDGADDIPQIRRAALQLCRLAKWDGCVVTTIAIPPGRGYRFTGAADGSLELVLPGFVQPRPRIRLDRLREKLTLATWTRLPESVRMEVTAMLKEAGARAGA